MPACARPKSLLATARSRKPEAAHRLVKGTLDPMSRTAVSGAGAPTSLRRQLPSYPDVPRCVLGVIVAALELQRIPARTWKPHGVAHPVRPSFAPPPPVQHLMCRSTAIPVGTTNTSSTSSTSCTSSRYVAKLGRAQRAQQRSSLPLHTARSRAPWLHTFSRTGRLGCVLACFPWS